MNEEQGKALVHAAKVSNAMLTTLTTMVAGYFLQSGVTGLLWLICWGVTLYGLFVIGTALTLFAVAALGYVVHAANAATQNKSEDARLQKLNEIYNRVNKNKE